MINVRLNGREPARQQNESLLLFRKEVRAEVVKEGLCPLKALGGVYLTSENLVFVTTKPVLSRASGITFTSFAAPLNSLRGESFNQPIFGCNNLSGQTDNGISFKLYFVSGGASVFLPTFRAVMRSVRSSASASRRAEANRETLARAQKLASSDPNDPSVVFLGVERGE